MAVAPRLAGIGNSLRDPVDVSTAYSYRRPVSSRARRSDQIVEAVEVQHPLTPCRGRSGCFQAAVISLQRMRNCARRAARKDDDAKAARAEFGGASHRRLAALDHVGQQRHARCESRAHGLHLVRAAQGLDEECIDAAGEVGLGALERRRDSLDRECIGARQDQRVGAAPAVERGAQLAAHLGRGNHGLAVEVATTLRELLVLDLDHRRAGALERPHRPLHVERVAEAGVGVDDHRHAHALGDERERLLDLGGGREPDVGPAEPGVGDRGAGEVQRLEAGLFGDERRKRVVDTRHEQRPRLRETLLQVHRNHSLAVFAAMKPPATALSNPLPER